MAMFVAFGSRKNPTQSNAEQKARAARRPDLELLEDRLVPSTFADTTTGVGVFEDQLPQLDSALTQFIATHTAGTQKQTLAEINAFRAYNPNYALLDYRLGTMAGPPAYIINGQWASDFSTVSSHEDWFLHQSYSGEPQSAADLASGRIIDTPDQSNAMDISNPNWQQYWLQTELQDMSAVNANGVFADSFTYGIGGAGYDSPPVRYQGTNAANAADWPGGVTWTTQLHNWAQTIESTFQQYNAAHGTNFMFIPNLDARVTSWEPSWVDNANGVPIMDGAFLEGFGQWKDTYDWTLSMNRGLNFTTNNKIVIMQPYFTDTPDSATGQQERNFYMGTYELLKGNQTYINMSDAGVAAQYFPEYQINLGAATTPLPTNVSSYLWNGVYRRDFQNGFVLVNPGSTSYTLNLGGTYQLVQGHGGGAMTDASLDANGNYIGGYLTYTNMSSITLAGGTAAIFLNEPSSNQPPTVATVASANPAPITGTTTNLSVLGADDGGESNLTYTWTASGPASVGFTANGSNASKNTTATFTKAGSYTFTATITDSGGLSTTSSVNVTVNQTLSGISLSPASATVTDGTTQQFSATGYDQFNQQLASQPGFTWSVASGAGSVSSSGLYTAPGSGTGTAVVQAASGGVTGSASVTLQSAVIAPSITTQPASQTVTAGQAVTFSVTATGTGPLSYQWQKSVNGAWSNVGTNAASYTINSTASTDAGSYRVQVSNSAGTATSNTASLTVNAPPAAPSITTQPASRSVTAGQSASFSVTATGTGPLAYQWQKLLSGTWTNISGATSATYTISSTASTDAGSYRVIVSNSVGSATSNTATLTVNAATLPAPWVDKDIGSPGLAGSASYSGGTFSVKGGGADIWNGSDQFNFTYQTLTGNGTIIARVSSQTNSNAWAKAGVMIRASTAANSTYAFAFITPGNGADFQYRTATGGSAGWSGQLSAAAPEWVKLVRSGNTFTGYASTDGVTWTTLGSVTISMGSTVDVGLAVTAHNNSATSTATFTNVLVGAPITVKISEDAYLGNALYTISVDGKQVGGIRTATAIHGQGQTQSVVLAGPYALGTHMVSVTFTNDAYGGTASTDRNLYVDGLSFDGKSYPGGTLFSNGTLTFSVGS